MAVDFTSQEISRKYDRFARWYDWVEGVPDLLGVSRLRRKLLRRASGKVLEIAVGTGKNLKFYPSDCRIIALDVSREMLNVASKRSRRLSLDVFSLLADAEALPFADKSFDTVVSSLSTCTFPNPIAALGEMRRVCKPAGKILLLEHGRSDREWLARFQDRRTDQFAKQLGCHWNREPLELVRKGNLKVKEARRFFFGVFHQIEAEPRPGRAQDRAY
jgi:ubiquinone/menaquinone biosynthesis C-methylase UbiE